VTFAEYATIKAAETNREIYIDYDRAYYHYLGSSSE
jgi:hypothetical protein